MANLFDDGSLIGFWPLNEPSGVPWFRNWSPRHANGPSGISFNWHVHHAVGEALGEPISFHPGTAEFTDPGSGVYGIREGFDPGFARRYGYCPLGTSDLIDQNDNLHRKVLVLGRGSFANRQICEPPAVAQSGFTIGFWVYPRTDGMSELISPPTAVNMETIARHSALMHRGDHDDGFFIGVSGKLSQAAQFEVDHANPWQLSAFATANSDAAIGSTDIINTPIESGTFTHVTFSYRYIDGTSNQIVLYKNGRVAASGNTTADLVAGELGYTDRLITIGGTQIDTSPTTDRIEESAGWGHLMSGVYIFERVLHEGEILEMHERGGLQIQNVTPPDFTPVVITDPSIISYVPVINPQMIDVTKYHNNLFTDFGLDQAGDFWMGRGPFDRGLTFDDSPTTSIDIGLAGGSGIFNGLFGDGKTNKSFTIGVMYHPSFTSSFLSQMVMSWGDTGLSSSTQRLADRTNCGFIVSIDTGVNNIRPVADFYASGTAASDGSRTTSLTVQDADYWQSTLGHLAIVWDEATFGIALYLNGELAESGHLAWSLGEVLTGVGGSGYPLVFGNGIISHDLNNLLMHNLGGNDMSMSEMFVANRPLEPAEIRYIANSGIDITGLFRGPHDPRLMGYWKGTDFPTNEMISRDRAGVWRGVDGLPGHMVRAISNSRWDDLIADTSNRGQQLYGDQYNNHMDPELGFTSGVWVVMGGSNGLHEILLDGVNRRCASSSFTQRFRSVELDNNSPSQYSEYLWGFEVTPSGEIPAVFSGNDSEQVWNSELLHFGDTADKLVAFLTTANAPAGSGVTLVWQGIDGTATRPLCSGNISYGDTSRILLRAKPIMAGYARGAVTNRTEFELYVNGLRVSDSNIPTSLTFTQPTGTPLSASDDWFLSIGGQAISDTQTALRNIDDGLGGIFMRNVFVMMGYFSNDEIDFLAASGIVDDKVLSGYDIDLPMTSVNTADPDLLGYWRFSGPDSGSGVTDLSLQGNNLRMIAREVLEEGGFSSTDNAASNLRYIPMPFANAPLSTQASGITYLDNEPANNNFAPPFAVSGSRFDLAASGFSVGLWVCVREATAQADDYYGLVAYGCTPDFGTNTSFIDASWMIFMDEFENMRMLMSTDGQMHTEPNSRTNTKGNIECGNFGTTSLVKDPYGVPGNKIGILQPAHVTAWQHYIWSYDHKNTSSVDGSGVLTCYFNGEPIDRQLVPSSGFHIPMQPDARMMTVFYHQLDGVPWDFQNPVDNDVNDPVITDLFYMARPVTDSEARYIAMHGIAPPVATPESGFLGGFILAVDGRTQTLGGYIRGLDTSYGILGGFMEAAHVSSGVLAGYIHSKDFGSGVLAGLIDGVLVTSGVLASYIAGSAQSSGVFAAYMQGSTPGIERFDAFFSVTAITAAEFDAQVQLTKVTSSEFDARVQLFKPECPPSVQIIVPLEGVSGVDTPLNQYFVGSGTADQDKTIARAEWIFGDLASPQVTFVSGQNLFPVSHVFTQSGFYTVRFTLTDSDGLSASDTVIINLASGVSPVEMTLSGIPQQGLAPLNVQFSQTIETLPTGVSVAASLLDYDDGQTSVTLNKSHVYSEPGIYRPIWIIRDSRGVFWSDTLEPGIDLRGSS